jgi:hypothetical protein
MCIIGHGISIIKEFMAMKRAWVAFPIIFVFSLACFFLIGDTGDAKDPPRIVFCEPHPARVVTVMELGWGIGDYEVGYISDEYRGAMEAGKADIMIGPNQFCVDGEESIYIDDTINNRILKYDCNGKYVSEVPFALITDRIGATNPFILPGPDCIYLYEYGGDMITRYRFQDQEAKTLSIPDPGIEHWEFEYVEAIYDEDGNTYFSKSIHSADGLMLPTAYYLKVDPSFSTILETRKVSGAYGRACYVDEEGKLYMVGHDGTHSADPLTLFKIRYDNNWGMIKMLPKNDESRQSIYSQRSPQEDLLYA